MKYADAWDELRETLKTKRDETDDKIMFGRGDTALDRAFYRGVKNQITASLTLMEYLEEKHK